MKTIPIFLIVVCMAMACKKESESERFILLTTPVWASDSLLADGEDASGPGGVLEKFKGDAKFRKDGTGYFGTYTGTWRFSTDETQLIISSDSLPIPVSANIAELTKLSLKITTIYPTSASPKGFFNIRMTFKAKP
ncbi:MAG: hypothetical protein ACPLXM_12225 [Bacteroidales bacterium]|nr:hypothetical protein [Bacteroidales bacterium]